MKRQIFLTYRNEPLPRWREAFGGAEIRGYPSQGAALGTRPGEAVVWLHLNPETKNVGDLVQAIAAAAPQCPLIVLSNVPNDEEGMAVLSAGAVGYCHALAVPELLQQVAQVVENGGLWVGPDLMQRLVTALAARSGQQMPTLKLASLSPREREVALAVAHGASNKEVARRLDITERTVKAHLSTVFEKMGVRDRLQLSLLINGAPGLAPAKQLVH